MKTAKTNPLVVRISPWIKELKLSVFLIKERGIKRFARPLILGFAMAYGTYFLVYRPLQREESVLGKKIGTMQEIARYADQYEEMASSLSAFESRLPPSTQRQDWLTRTVLATMAPIGIVSNEIQPPQETRETGFVLQTVQITTNAPFSQLMRWLNAIEKTKSLIHISSLEVTKDSKILGQETISCQLSTIIPDEDPSTP